MLSGPKREWQIVLLAMAFGAVILAFGRGRAFTKTDVVEVQITLITADRGDLDCGLDQSIQGLSCGFRSDGAAVTPPPALEARLAPYMTPDRRLLLVPGLFEQPALSERYDRERPTSRPKHRLKRFIAKCQMELLTKVPKVKVRFGKRNPWGDAGDAWVAKPRSCSVQD